LIHPMREGRSPQQIGRKGLSNHRWIVGGKLCLLLNQWGLVVGWACATANTADNSFQFRVASAVYFNHTGRQPCTSLRSFMA
jgi:hypothetical protein